MGFERSLLKSIFPDLFTEEEVEVIETQYCSNCGIELDNSIKVKGRHICRICYNFLSEIYYQSHREQCKSYVDPQRAREDAHRWYQNHTEEAKANAKRWRRNNPDKANACVKRWRDNNPEKVKLLWKFRNYRKHNAEGRFTLEEWNAKLEEYNYRCAYCGCELNSDTITIDHQIPLFRGGTNYIDNLVPACRSCNSKKHTKTAEEFMATLIKDNECLF